MSERVVNVFPEGVCYAGERIRWWNWPRFRLVPRLTIKPETDYDKGGFHFSWLWLELRLYAPYLIVSWKLPLFPASWHQKLWRVKRYPHETAYQASDVDPNAKPAPEKPSGEGQK